MNMSFKTSIDLTSVQCDGAFELAVNASPAAQSKDLHQFSRDNIFKNQKSLQNVLEVGVNRFSPCPVN